LPQEAGIQDVFRHLAIDQARTDAVAAEVIHAYSQGRKVLVLTERTEHLDAAYFRPWRTAFQSEGGHDFKLIADSVSDDRGHRFKVKADSISS
jgi:hypothetical protein